MKNKVKVSAPGKIILSGEHAVVYGYPEILCAVDRRLSVEIEETVSKEENLLVKNALEILKARLNIGGLDNLKIKIESQIPIGGGMGSSAALAVAMTTAFFQFLRLPHSLKKINEIAYEIEKKQHSTPSGGDNTISTYGGFLWYRKETETFKTFSPLKTKVLPPVYLLYSGKPEETTGEMVKKVKGFISESPLKAADIFREIEQITRKILGFLMGEKQNFSDLIVRNERLLEQLGVVSVKTKRLIGKIEAAGGAAKISGAGGVKGDSGVILAYHQNSKILQKLANEEKIEVFKVKLGEKGVKNEQS